MEQVTDVPIDPRMLKRILAQMTANNLEVANLLTEITLRLHAVEKKIENILMMEAKRGAGI